MAEPLPASIGPYAIESILGSGGMGVVYRAHAPDGMPVAVKVLLGSVTVGSLGRRFAQEATVRIAHPNVVRVLDDGEVDGQPYLVQELLDGETLEAQIKRGPLPWSDAIALVIQACRGLEAVHARGIVHRDLKPGNLFVTTSGIVKLLDFGIARVGSRETRMTVEGAILGTPAYLSPEQARGDLDIDARADIWALGAVLYESVCGTVPFERATVMATMVAVLFDAPRPLEARNPALPGPLCRIVERCLQKNPAQRYSNATELRTGLEGLTLDSTSPTLVDTVLQPQSVRSIAPGEQRLIVLLLADGVLDLHVITAAVEERGGIVSALLGNRAIGVFGAERWEGDEASRTAAAALRCRHAATQIAIASGHASSRDGLVSGIAVERAARGCAAGLDGIAVDPETAALLAETFSLRRKADLFEVVAERRQTERPAIHASPQTFGREIELAQLRVILEATVEERRAASVLVTGPPGAGKTHLLRDVRALVKSIGPEDGTVLTATARPLSGGLGLSLLRSLLEQHAAVLHRSRGAPRLTAEAPPEERRQAVIELASEGLPEEAKAREHAIFLGELLGVPVQDTSALRAARLDAQLMADRLRLALFGWLEGLLARGPVALMLEDVHWADTTSLALLEEVLVQNADTPLLLVATARPELDEQHPDLFAKYQHIVRFARVALRGLSAVASRSLAEAVASSPLPDGLARALHERTGGNPLFIVQIVATLREAGQLDQIPEQMPLPVTVEAAAQSRLDHLPADEKDLCRRVSVWGRPFAASEVAALGIADAPPRLASLVRRDVLVSGGGRGAAARYQFRSPLVMEVAYRMLDRPFRAEMHAKAGACLAAASDAMSAVRAGTRSGIDPEEVARHFDLGDRSSEAARWYVTATLEASARADSATVLRASDRALALAVEPAARFELCMARAEALHFLGRRDAQGLELNEAHVVAISSLERARALSERVSWLTRVGRAVEAVGVADGAVKAARAAGDEEIIALALGRRAEALMSLGSYSEAQAALHEASSAIGDRSPRISGRLAGWQGHLAARRGDEGERKAAYELAARLLGDAGDVRRAAAAEVNLGDAYNRFGDHQTALRALERALDGVRRVGHRAMEGYALVNIGYSKLRLGDFTGASQALADAASLAEEQHNSRLLLTARIYEARIALATGRADDAMTHAEHAIHETEQSDQPGLRALALAGAARAALALGEVSHAWDFARAAMSLRDELGGLEEGEADLFLSLAESEFQSGDVAAAAKTLSLGRRWLLDAAARIADPEWRRRFVEDVPEHRALLARAGDAEGSG